MLELKDVSFEVTDKKGQKEILNNMFLEINYTNSNICQYNENYRNIK